MIIDNKQRCFGSSTEPLYRKYHDNEWSIPVYDDIKLFEMLLLEGAQAGLSFKLILNKREGYRQLFYQFDPVQVAKMTDEELTLLCSDIRIVRNRLKIFAARTNAIVFLQIQKEYSSFAKYAWQFVDHKPVINQWRSKDEVPTATDVSRKFSKDLKKRGMKFVGETIMYAYMQSVGMINDHLETCWCYKRDRNS